MRVVAMEGLMNQATLERDSSREGKERENLERYLSQGGESAVPEREATAEPFPISPPAKGLRRRSYPLPADGATQRNAPESDGFAQSPTLLSRVRLPGNTQ